MAISAVAVPRLEFHICQFPDFACKGMLKRIKMVHMYHLCVGKCLCLGNNVSTPITVGNFKNFNRSTP